MAFIPTVTYARTGPSFEQQTIAISVWGPIDDAAFQHALTSSGLNTNGLFDMINGERAKYGLQPLAHSPDLTAAAQNHSNDMATNNFFCHTGSDGSNGWQRIVNLTQDYPVLWSNWAENINSGYGIQNGSDNVYQPYNCLTSWMDSTQGHRENILNPSYTHAGVGYAVSATNPEVAYRTLVLAQRA